MRPLLLASFLHIRWSSDSLDVWTVINSVDVAKNLQEFIAKQAPFQSDLFLKREAKCRDLLCAIRMMAFLVQSTVSSEIGKQFKPLWEEFADQLNVLFLDADDKGKKWKKRHWKTSFQTCSTW